MSKVWFIAGAGSGIGAGAAKAARKAGDRVVATDEAGLRATHAFEELSNSTNGIS